MNYDNLVFASHEVAAAAAVLRDHPDFKLQVRLDQPHARPARPDLVLRKVALLDCETTSLNVDTAEIIELAIKVVEIGRGDWAVGHLPTRCWLEQPEFGVPEEVTELTGLTDAMVAGQKIDDDEVAAVLADVDLIVAHNAAYDRPIFERRFPSLFGRAWACSMTSIDWSRRGLEGRRLGDLLAQVGYFTNAHRAGDDVWALMHLIWDTQAWPELLARAEKPSYRVEAVGAPYAKKDALRLGGFRWDAHRRVWFALCEDPMCVSSERELTFSDWPQTRKYSVSREIGVSSDWNSAQASVNSRSVSGSVGMDRVAVPVARLSSTSAHCNRSLVDPAARPRPSRVFIRAASTGMEQGLVT